MANVYAQVGINIKKYRKQNRLTQEDLADKAKMDPKSVIEIEAGKRNPTVKTIKKIASVLKIPIASLFE